MTSISSTPKTLTRFRGTLSFHPLNPPPLINSCIPHITAKCLLLGSKLKSPNSSKCASLCHNHILVSGGQVSPAITSGAKQGNNCSCGNTDSRVAYVIQSCSARDCVEVSGEEEEASSGDSVDGLSNGGEITVAMKI